MCGIAGWVARDRDMRAERAVVEAMTRAMVPRGPDDGGLWISGDAALGHRRLAVIDIEGGRQPMATALRGDGGDSTPEIVVVFSGEIYNFQTLRRELERRHHRFRTCSDTEVMLRSYVEWGWACVERLEGMFAFAIWDAEVGKLTLARDRLGVKPLYYYAYGDGIVFGSEPKAILANPVFAPELDDEGIAELFGCPGAPTPGHGVYRGLVEVRPGHVFEWHRDASATTCYWRLEAREHDDDYARTVVRVRELLEGVVTRQLVSDVPVATLLSGGLDSSIITALAAQERVRRGFKPLASFSMDYALDAQPFEPDAWRPSRDEPFARIVADHLCTDHTFVQLTADSIAGAMRRSLGARDLPGWGDLDASLSLLFDAVRENHVVALSGEAGDEVFGGYPWHADRRAIQADGFPWLHGVSPVSQLLRDEVRCGARVDDYVRQRYREAIAEVPRLARESDFEHRTRVAFYLGLTRWLPLLLDRKDRLSMAIGLEVRVPYCDHRLVEYAWNVAPEMRFRGGVEKALLRDAARDLLPQPIAERKKCAPPACRSVGYEDRMRAELRELAKDAHAPLFEIVDRDRLRQALSAGAAVPGPTPGPRTSFGIGYLLDVDRWLRHYRVRIV